MNVIYGAMSGVIVGTVVTNLFFNGRRKPEIVGTLAVIGGISGYLLTSTPQSTAQYFELKNVNIQIASNLQEIEPKIQHLLSSISQQKHKLIGLDTEWKPSHGSSQPPLGLTSQFYLSNQEF